MITRCGLCPGVNKCLPPSGPETRGGILFIGEAPGINEEKTGVVFIGKTGDEVNRHYLPLAGLRRDQTCFTDAIRCLPVSAGGKLDPNRGKDIALLESCAEAHLYPLIRRMQPRVIVPLGSFACKAVCPEVDLELQHGHPIQTAWGIPAFPSFHPALGMHSPKQMLYIRTDWIRFKHYLKDTLRLPHDDYPDPDYAEVTDTSEIDDIDPTIPFASDTEFDKDNSPYCLTYSQAAGTGRLIRVSRVDLLERLQQKFDVWESVILFHNWLADWPIVEKMNLRLPIPRVVDTMARVYHLGNLPQGLKALARRELGVDMLDFPDLVKPWSSKVVLDYYEQAFWEDWPTPEPEMVRAEGGVWKLYKPQNLKTKLKRFFTDYKKQPNKDVFAQWDNWESEWPMIEERLGPWPGKDIRHVPFELALPYACRDADVLLRLWPVLQGMSRRVRRYPQDQWRERVSV